MIMKQMLQKMAVVLIALLIAIPSFAQFDNPSRNPRRQGGQNRQGRVSRTEIVERSVVGNILSRKSVRSFTGEVVSKEKLEQLVKLGMAAPTASNRQPWQFYATNDKSIIEAASAKLGRHGGMVKEAGAVIVVCGDPSKSEKFWAIDGSCAAENILLGIEAMGLGGVWLSAYPNEERMTQINEAFNIPSEYKVLCIIPVGYPKGEQKAKDKWDESKFHFDKW